MSHYKVTFKDVILAHDEAISYGGRSGIASIALIESAISRPYSGYYRRIHQKSAALLHSLVKNHGFVDGNKRTALLVTFLFISRSGYVLVPLANEQIDDMVVSVAEDEIKFDDLVEWFEIRLKKG